MTAQNAEVQAESMTFLGLSVFIGENDMFPMMLGGKPDSYGAQPRVSRWDIIKHGYWGLAWRGKNRQEIDQFGTMDEDEREDLSKIAQREFSRQLEVERQRLPTDINEKQLRTICNKAFNEAAFVYYLRFMDTSDGPLAHIPSWSVYGADVSYQYLALNYSLDRFQMPSPGARISDTLQSTAKEKHWKNDASLTLLKFPFGASLGKGTR